MRNFIIFTFLLSYTRPDCVTIEGQIMYLQLCFITLKIQVAFDGTQQLILLL